METEIMHGQFLRGKKGGVNWDRSWHWIAKGDIKACTEALIWSAQEQASRAKYTKFYIDKSSESPICRMCGQKAETISYLVSECSKLAPREYKRRHDNVTRYIHWQLCIKGGFERADRWYNQQPEAIIENENYKLLWDFTIQCDRMIEARRQDIVLVDKMNKEVKIKDIAVPGYSRVKEKELEKIEKYQYLREEIGHVWQMRIAVPGDSRVKEKELEKIEKYQYLMEEIGHVWQMRNATVVAAVIGALGVISDKFEKHIK